MNGSRAPLAQALASHPTLLPVLISAPAECLADRLANRGREDATARAQRRERNPALVATWMPGMVTIDHGGHLHRAGMALLRVLAEEDDHAHHPARQR